MPLVVGVDFDNTIVSYDSLFARLAQELGVVEPGTQLSRVELRDLLHDTGRVEVWLELQSLAYGTRITEAEPHPGVLEFFSMCDRDGIELYVISHKTQFSYHDRTVDLRDAGYRWLEAQGLLAPDGPGLGRSRVFFEGSRQAKIERIISCRCTHFVDDLPEVLCDPSFPAEVNGFLFDPNHQAEWTDVRATLRIVPTWRDMMAVLATEQHGAR